MSDGYYIEWPLSTQIESRSIAVITLNGAAPKNFFDIPVTVYQGAGIRWAPDGQSISYVDNRGGSSNIWSQPLAGGPPKQLTDFRGDRLFAFDWSHDGTQLACLRGIYKQDVVMISDFSLRR
jgi:Tol biopolymer transport system component